MNRQTTSERRRNGFSLIELLLAVTMLALLGTIVLQVFLASQELNRRALALDRAVWLNVDAVERLKAVHPAETLNRELLTSLFPEATLTAADQGWQLTLLLDAQYQPHSPADSGEPAFAWRMRIVPDPAAEGLSSLATATVLAMPDKHVLFPGMIQAQSPFAAQREAREADKPSDVHTIMAALACRCEGEGEGALP